MNQQKWWGNSNQLESMTMKRLTVSLVIFVILVVPVSLAVDATGNLSVSATVAANCRVNSGALNFNTYDPGGVNASTPLQRSGSFRVTCTNGTPGTVMLSQGNNPTGGSSDASPLRRMEGDPGIYLRYDIYQDVGYTTVWGNTTGTAEAVIGTGGQSFLTVYGRVLPGQIVPPGTYSDTVTVTVSF